MELGRFGEALAKEYLLKAKLHFRASNYRWKRQEIDLIFSDDETLIFVEVKARASNTYGDPHQSVSRTKQRNLLLAANAYIQEHNADLDARFDVISIIHNRYETHIEHIKNAFYPTL